MLFKTTSFLSHLHPSIVEFWNMVSWACTKLLRFLLAYLGMNRSFKSITHSVTWGELGWWRLRGIPCLLLWGLKISSSSWSYSLPICKSFCSSKRRSHWHLELKIILMLYRLRWNLWTAFLLNQLSGLFWNSSLPHLLCLLRLFMIRSTSPLHTFFLYLLLTIDLKSIKKSFSFLRKILYVCLKGPSSKLPALRCCIMHLSCKAFLNKPHIIRNDELRECLKNDQDIVCSSDSDQIPFWIDHLMNVLYHSRVISLQGLLSILAVDHETNTGLMTMLCHYLCWVAGQLKKNVLFDKLNS